MAMQLSGDSTGDFVGEGGSEIHFTPAGGIVVQIAAGQALQYQDSAGNVLAQMDANSRPGRVVKVPLAAVDTAGGVFSWQNPEAGAIIIDRVELDVTTVATGACTVDVGSTSASATTLSDNLIDGADVHTAVALFDNITDIGANGKSRQKIAAGKWITGSTASGASAGIVGNAYIHYHLA